MTELEILAGLKIAYIRIEDIIRNADDTQLKSVGELFTALNILDKKYIEMYEKYKKKTRNYYITEKTL